MFCFHEVHLEELQRGGITQCLAQALPVSAALPHELNSVLLRRLLPFHPEHFLQQFF